MAGGGTMAGIVIAAGIVRIIGIRVAITGIRVVTGTVIAGNHISEGGLYQGRQILTS